MPDESAGSRPAILVDPSAKTPAIDVLFDLPSYLATFGQIPGWVDAEGFPTTWVRYTYGIRYLNRAAAVHRLDMFQAFSSAQNIDKTSRDTWLEYQKIAAGWR